MPIPAGPSGAEAGDGINGPCDDWTPFGDWTCNLTGAALAVTGEALTAATEVLYWASGQQFGLCTQTIRPCRRDCWGMGSYNWGRDLLPTWGGSPFSGWPTPALINGEWFNLVCGACGDNCSCTMISEAMLPGPVWSVTTVKVDGVTLTPDVDYRVDDNRILVRLGGEMWPACNDLSQADTEEGTWSATVEFGQPPPTLGGIAVGALAAEIAKLLVCDASCGLSPFFLSSFSRQGVSASFDTEQEFGNLPAVSLFIRTFNPNGLRGPAVAYNLDGPNFRRVGT